MSSSLIFAVTVLVAVVVIFVIVIYLNKDDFVKE
jgi:hypothetical protein